MNNMKSSYGCFPFLLLFVSGCGQQKQQQQKQQTTAETTTVAETTTETYPSLNLEGRDWKSCRF